MNKEHQKNLEELIGTLELKLTGLEPDSEEYSKVSKQLELLAKIQAKEEETRNEVNKLAVQTDMEKKQSKVRNALELAKILAEIGMFGAGLWMNTKYLLEIIHFEQTGTFSTKAFNTLFKRIK